jgi:hypothetical protein
MVAYQMRYGSTSCSRKFCWPVLFAPRIPSSQRPEQLTVFDLAIGVRKEKASQRNARLLLSVSTSAHRETSPRSGQLIATCQTPQSTRAVRRR